MGSWISDSDSSCILIDFRLDLTKRVWEYFNNNSGLLYLTTNIIKNLWFICMVLLYPCHIFCVCSGRSDLYHRRMMAFVCVLCINSKMAEDYETWREPLCHMFLHFISKEYGKTMYEILFSTRHNYHPRSPLKLTQVMWIIKATHHYFLYLPLTLGLLNSGACCHTGNHCVFQQNLNSKQCKR